PGLDAAATRSRSRSFAAEHQLHRAPPLRTEPAAGAQILSRVRLFHRRDLFAGDSEMKVPILGIPIDERFLTHRLRSTTIAGITGGLVAIGLFAYRYYVDHFWSWDLFAVGATIVLVKLSMMFSYRCAV